MKKIAKIGHFIGHKYADYRPKHRPTVGGVNVIACTCNDDMHKSSKELEFWPDPTTDCRVSCLERLKKIPICLFWRIKQCCHFFSAVPRQFVFILAGNQVRKTSFLVYCSSFGLK